MVALPLAWTLLGLGCAHIVADGGQGRLSRLKRRLPRGEAAARPLRAWLPFLLLHGGLHGLGVGLALLSWPAALFEWAAHCLIDWGKCEGAYGSKTDQALHVACKFIWLALFWRGDSWL